MSTNQTWVEESLGVTSGKPPSNISQLYKTLTKMYSGQTTKIVCSGDSLTAGIGNPYPAVLQARLQKVYENNNITVINKGVGGRTTTDALANFDAEVIAQKPDLSIVMFGINDGNPVTNTSQDKYKNNLIQMIKKLQAAKSEIILMSPTPIIKNENDRHRKLQTYAKAAREVATLFGIPFIDTFYEVYQLFFNKQEVPTDFYMDLVHLNDPKYNYIADMIVARLLDYHNQTGILSVDTKKEFFVPLVNSTFVDTDITLSETNSNQFFKDNYVLESDNSKGTKLKLQFYIAVPGMDVFLGMAKTQTGGQISVLDNGSAIKTVDCFSNTSTAYDAEELLLENAAMGYHCIELLASNLVPGQSTNVSLGRIRPSYVSFRPTKKADETIYNPGSGGFGVLEKYRKINDGLIRFNNATGNSSGVVFSSKETVGLKTGKTLVIEVEGKFAAGSGISWFSNKTNGIQKITNGYMLYLGGSNLRLYNGTASGLGDQLATYTTTPDFNVTHKIRITHSDTGVITVFFDNIQAIQFTNTKDKTGWFGLHQEVNGNIEVTRYEYSYI